MRPGPYMRSSKSKMHAALELLINGESLAGAQYWAHLAQVNFLRRKRSSMNTTYAVNSPTSA